MSVFTYTVHLICTTINNNIIIAFVYHIFQFFILESSVGKIAKDIEISFGIARLLQSLGDSRSRLQAYLLRHLGSLFVV